MMRFLSWERWERPFAILGLISSLITVATPIYLWIWPGNAADALEGLVELLRDEPVLAAQERIYGGGGNIDRDESWFLIGKEATQSTGRMEVIACDPSNGERLGSQRFSFGREESGFEIRFPSVSDFVLVLNVDMSPSAYSRIEEWEYVAGRFQMTEIPHIAAYPADCPVE